MQKNLLSGDCDQEDDKILCLPFSFFMAAEEKRLLQLSDDDLWNHLRHSLNLKFLPSLNHLSYLNLEFSSRSILFSSQIILFPF